jgi:hypothetical protein
LFILRENIMLIHLFMQQFADYFDVRYVVVCTNVVAVSPPAVRIIIS